MMKCLFSNFKLFLVLFLVLALPSSIAGQTAKPKGSSATRVKSVRDGKRANRPIRPVEIENLVGEAYYAPAEFAADALIHIAGSNRVTDKQWKKELLEAAFRFAAEAQQPVQRKSAVVGNYSVDTDAGYLSHAFERKLDALSLRSRVVRAMLAIDKRRTRDMFSEISPKLSLSPLSCEDALVYDVTDFYDILRLVAQETFTPVEIEQSAQVRFVLPYVEAISAHTQVVPMLKVISSLKSNQAESLTLIHAFTQALKKIDDDNRSFSYELVRGGMLREVNQIAQTLERQEISTKELLATYRDYLRKNLKSARCADGAISDERTLSYYLKESNALFFNNDPLTADDVKPTEILGKAKVYEYWKSPNAERLLTLAKALRFGSKINVPTTEEDQGDDDKPLTEAEKQTPAWQEQLAQLLNEFEDWDRKEERSEMDYFHQKQVLYMGLLEITPSGLGRDLILRSWIASLDERSIENISRVEWFLYVDQLLRRLRDLPAEERAKMLEAIISSKNPALVLHAKLLQLHI